MVCYCKEVTKGQIVSAIRNSADSLKKIQQTTGACTGNNCAEMNPSGKCCDTDIIEILRIEGIEEKPSCSCCCDKNCC
ncbi:(2Fe-2S)-binding protein [bacterium]|nr:(2Fe-2S)-binding protein [bacterium]